MSIAEQIKEESKIELLHTPTGIKIVENSTIFFFLNRERAFERLKICVPNYKKEDVKIKTFEYTLST